MNLYLDSSALMRRYLSRPGAAETDQILDSAAQIATAAITRIEVAAALHRLKAGGVLSTAELQRALTALDDDLSHFAKVAVSQEVLDEAYRICGTRCLKGYDAVHATLDDQFWTAASAEGFEVWPEDLDAFKSPAISTPTGGDKASIESEVTG